MRRRIHRLLFALAACAGGCAAFRGEGPANVDGVDAGVVDADAADALDAGTAEAITFRDTFDDGGPSGAWQLSLGGGATFSFVADGGNTGGGVVFTATGAATNQYSLLRKDVGDGPPTYEVRMSFHAKVSVAEGSRFEGPRLLTGSAGNRRDLVISFLRSGAGVTVRLSHNAPNCTDCGALPTLALDVDGGWHHYALDVGVGAANVETKTYGVVKFTVDDNVAYQGTLWLPLASAKGRALAFGVSYAAPDAGGTIALDDAFLEIR